MGIKSYRWALRGIRYAVKTQHNIRIQLLAAVLVTAAGIVFGLDLLEWALVIAAIGSVLAAEVFNTAVESLVDLIAPGYSEKAGFIKDAAAGAVLIAAVTSAIIGSLIFIPKIIALLK
jgi:diacylglycerol kinase